MNRNIRNIVLSSLLIVSACNKSDGPGGGVTPPTPPVVTPPVVETFQGPLYSDNYTPLASWSMRGQWNLANVHDPTVEKCGEYYYMYQTDASYGNAHDGNGHFFYRRSKDLVNWDFMGPVMMSAPAWVKDSLNNKRARMSPALPPIANPNYGYWAPCIKKVGTKFRLYYSIVVIDPIVGTSTDNSWSERAFIGLAETDDLATNNWTDKGMVVCSEPDGVRSYNRSGPNDWSGYFKFNAIDPSFVQTPEGEQWLIYGSWHSGIAALKLNTTTGKPDRLQSIDDYGIRIAGRGVVSSNRWQALEGAEIVYNAETGYYYLFLAYDELSVAYNTRVCRSRNITGPYEGMDGGNITNGAECFPLLTHPYQFSGHTGWVGISHCAVFQNPDSKAWYYASQGRLPANVPGINVSNAVMMGQVRQIKWTPDGWPVVMPERYAAVPDSVYKESDFVGTWEIIPMAYQYQVMQTSKQCSFNANNTITGSITGTWSYDAAKKLLNINSQPYPVAEAWNWEAATRKRTISFAGFSNAKLTLWGKKL
ncbi:MAG TPA: arabinan endo-1,5-alpha-L-arabinosidase [Phnomibacter sp.]|nr:arabinan endo-1,5-alpha-L-arabinosidase [Phnomibacter sp.]